MVSSTSSAFNLTVSNAASGGYALKVMTVVTAILFPVVLLYQGWSFHVFRERLTGSPSRPEPGPASAASSVSEA